MAGCPRTGFAIRILASLTKTHPHPGSRGCEMTSLWLNKRELQYIECVMRDDMVEFPDGDEILTEEMRNKLYEKVIALKKEV
jgi:hypothetical protein